MVMIPFSKRCSRVVLPTCLDAFDPCSRRRVVSYNDVLSILHIPLINLSNLDVPVKIEMLISVSRCSLTDFIVIFSIDVRPNLRFL